MIECSISELCAATGAALLRGDADARLRGVAIDSRKVEPGGLFVAFPGERVDGNAYAARALEAGAACVALTGYPAAEALAAAEATGAAIVRIEDDDPEEFLLRLAGWWRLRHDWLVVGVTGSVGKTTTKDMLACALACRFKVHATAGNFNNLIGVPLTLLSAPDDAEALVVEMGMNHPGEITRLAACARPRVACITNVGTSHIGILGSRENIARAKGEVCAGLAGAPDGGRDVEARLFLTAGDDFTGFISETFAGPAGVPVTLVGERGSACWAGPVSLDGDAHPSFEVSLDDGATLSQRLSLTGAQVVPDYLLALAIARHLGVAAAEASEALAHLEATHMRQEVVSCPGGFRVIDDSYNASPNSTAAALDALCSMRMEGEGGRRIAILGEIGELGEQEGRLHELVGAYAAAKPLDVLVLVGTDRADRMEEAAKLMGCSEDRIVRVGDVDALIEVFAPVLEKGDLVLVKASRAAYLDRFVREVAR